MTDHYVGSITATRRTDGTLALNVIPGPIRVSRMVIKEGDPELLRLSDDLLTFWGCDDDGARLAFQYRIVGEDSSGPEGGWLLCEPMP